jgi:SAM-dependent methyltransferase
MSGLVETVDADRSLKAKHRAMWTLGDYPSVAAEIIPGLGATVVAACHVAPGDRVLDIAAGSGNAAIPAAQAGGDVVACDLTPALLEAGRQEAVKHGVTIEWREADAESLSFADASFDVVLSCVGVMFAPHHQASADELVRVCRPGGRIGLVSWTAEGFVGQMLATVKPYVAPPPPDTQPPSLWGDADHVRHLLGGHVVDVAVARQSVRVDRFASPEEFRDYFKARYGPIVAAYKGIADNPNRVAALDRDLANLARRNNRCTEGFCMDWEYLLLTARTAQ